MPLSLHHPARTQVATRPLLHAARVALQGLPVVFAHTPFASAPLHVLGKPGQFLSRIDLYVHPADLSLLRADLVHGGVAPPVWTAWRVSKASQPVNWSWGYQEARRAVFPVRDVYRSSSDVDLRALCRHADPQVRRARLRGGLAYLRYFSPLLPVSLPERWMNAAV